MGMISQASIKSLLRDPALAAMGLVPAVAAADAALPRDFGAPMSWRAAWTAIALGFIALVGLFWGTASQMVSTWYNSDTFNHGFLILPICGYLVWIKRGALAGQAPTPTLWGLLLMLAAAFGWLLGEVASVFSVQQFALVIMVQALIVTVLGLRIAWLLVFPLFYMFFAVPFGEFLVPPLQDLTAVFTVALLRLIEIPVFLDGIFISIPTGNFEVAEACSGVRFLIATLALGFLFAELTYVSRWRRAAFIGLSFIVPIVANGFRAFGIVLIAYLTDNKLAVGVDHIIYGWIFFAIVTVILLAIGMTFRDGMPADPLPDADAMRRAAAQRVAPRRILAAGMLGVLIAAGAQGYAVFLAQEVPAPLASPLTAPQPGGGWRAVTVESPDWTPHYPGASARLMQSYEKDGHVVSLFIAYYTHERPGAEMIGAANSVTGEGWTRAASGTALVSVDGEKVEAERSRLLRRPRGRIAYHWYWIGDWYMASPYLAKMVQAYNRLLVGDDPSAVILVSAAYEDLPAEADRRLKDFLSSLGPVRPMLTGLSR
jgi:exosortase A